MTRFYCFTVNLAFRPGNDLNETAARVAMESCIAEISQWMHLDKLKLNSDKTEFLLIGTRQQLRKVGNITHLSIGVSRISPSYEVQNLGAWFDSKMNMLGHINKTYSSAFYHLYNIRRIRTEYLSRPAAESLVHAFTTSRVDSVLQQPFIWSSELAHLETPLNTECRS